MISSGGNLPTDNLPTGPGNHWNLKKRKKVSINPNQKNVMDDPKTAKIRTNQSIQESLNADPKIPKGTPKIKENKTPKNASSYDAGNLSMSSSETLPPVRIDVPRSKWIILTK